ncbi:MAG TPA: chromosomal replication initiator protein DnaA [Deltaproteobacteria bacterium]|nr:chromosomal replication initiator protein DnaA [Deltaproteobacteria bacterium]HBG72778.1 chromosomal replication initiator protein DnaA [Deltaproteobacteria bacterium]
MTSKAWEKILAQLRGEVSEQVFETWLRPLRYVTREGPVLFVATPHKFFKQWIEDNHLARIEEIARKELAEEVTVEIMVGSEEEEPPSPGSVSSRLMLPEETATRARTVFGLLNNRYTFDRFVIGTGNQFAHAASVAVANDPGNSYNPLFIYGGVGLGKTHLLHAIGNAALEKSPRLMVCYIPAEKFTNDLIASLRSGKMSDFKERYRNVDLLLMDDVQFIAGKRSTQEEFFHTFNELYSTRRQVVVTSDKFPKEIPDLEERIQSRFEWGLVADIQAPDIETRVAILNRKAELENITLPEDVALFLATAVKNNIRELEGCLIRIGAHASLTRKEINLDLAKAILAPILGNAGREISPDMIQKAVADHFGVKLSELRSDRKHKVIAMPRQVAMYLMREMTRCSFPDIGQRFGGRDHTTVMYAVKKIEKNLADDVSLRNTVDTLRKKIEG